MMDPQQMQLMQQQMALGQAGGETDPRMNQMKRQQRMADMLRSASMAPREMSGGRVSRGWGGVLEQVAQGVMANKMQGQADQTMGQINTERQGDRARYMDQMMMALRSRIPGSNTAMLPPDGMEDR